MPSTDSQAADYHPFTKLRIAILMLQGIASILLFIYLISVNKLVLVADQLTVSYTKVVNGSIYESARYSLLSYYSSESGSHATLILSLFLALFTLVQVKRHFGKFFPAILAGLFSLVAYLSIRLVIWSQLSSLIISITPVNFGTSLGGGISIPALEQLFTRFPFLVYFSYSSGYTVLAVSAIFLGFLCLAYFGQFLKESRKSTIEGR